MNGQSNRTGSGSLMTFAVADTPLGKAYKEASAHLLAQRLAGTTSYAPRSRGALTVQEMAIALREGGMPVSALADAAQVERKTIYSWLNGSAEVRGTNAHRMALVFSLLTVLQPDVDPRNIYRFWNTPTEDGKTLRELMVADPIDQYAAHMAILSLRTAALRAMDTERRVGRSGGENPILRELPDATTER